MGITNVPNGKKRTVCTKDVAIRKVGHVPTNKRSRHSRYLVEKLLFCCIEPMAFRIYKISMEAALPSLPKGRGFCAKN